MARDDVERKHGLRNERDDNETIAAVFGTVLEEDGPVFKSQIV